jgi:hypothetical protein
MSSKSPTGPAGPPLCACCAIAQTFFCIASVFLRLALSWSAISGGNPHFARVCRHLSQTSAQTRCNPARKFRAVFS